MSTVRWFIPALAAFALLAPDGAAARPASSSGGLSLEGSALEGVSSLEYPGVTAEVIEEASGADYFVKKHIGQPRYGEVTLTVGAESKGIYDWVAAAWAMNYQRKNGKIVVGDTTHEFFNALITETTLPAVDANSRAAVGMQVKFAPEYTRQVKPTGGEPGSPKLWTANSFRFSVEGLDTSKVVRVDKLVVKQTAVTDDIGDARD